MALPAAAREFEVTQHRIHDRLDTAVRRLWRRMPVRGSWERAWAGIQPSMTAVITTAQGATTGQTALYMSTVLSELDLATPGAPKLNLDSLVGVAGDGRDVTSGAYGAVVTAAGAYADLGNTAQDARAALTEAEEWISSYASTIIADTARQAQAAITAGEPRASGYIRMVEPGACSRCVILAGRFYRYNQGFDRHPRCKCVHVPADENLAGDFRTNPSLYFEQLPKDEQDRVFTKAGAEAIRLGADPSQVVNARRGMTTAQQNPRGWIPKGRLVPTDVHGRPTYITTEGTTRRGTFGRINAQRKADGKPKLPVRLMPESIIALAKDRDDAVRLLKLYGYLA